MRARGIIVAAAVVLVAGCGSGAATETTVTQTEGTTVVVPTTVTVTATPVSSAATPTAAQAAQPLGTRQAVGDQGHVTAFTVDRNVAPAPGNEGGETRTAIDVEACLDGPNAETAQIGTTPWVVTDATNGRYDASNTRWSQDPQPEYPVQAPLQPGECVRGWIVTTAPSAAELKTVRYEMSGATPLVLSWAAA